MEGFLVLVYVVMFVWGILNIILFFKLWGMTNDVKDIKDYLCPPKANTVIKENSSNEVINQRSVIHDNILFQEGDVVKHKETQEELKILQLTMNDNAAICANSRGDKVTYYLNSLDK